MSKLPKKLDNFLTMTCSLILASLLYGIGHYLFIGQIDIVNLIKYTICLIIGSSIVFLIISETKSR